MTGKQPSENTRNVSAARAVASSTMPPWPVCGEDEQQAALRVLRSGKLNYWTGDEGRLFEQEFAEFVGASHAIAVANGTVGLELALAVLDIGPGDEVIVPSRTFIATASAVVMRGATPVCADVDRDSQNITVQTIAAKLSPQTRAIIPVHLAGWPCDMQPILEFAREHNLFVIEDCAQAHGARYQGQHVGTLGDIGVFSFCQDKIMTTAGEGGMILTNNRELWKCMWSMKDHGKCHDAVYHEKHVPGFRWLHRSFGTNGRMTEVQSAIGRIVLRKLDGWVKSRKRKAAILTEHLAPLPALRIPLPSKGFSHSYYKFYAFLHPEKLRSSWNRDLVMNEISARGVTCFSGSCSEIYLEQAFGEELRPALRFPIARELGETSLMFLVDPTLSEDTIIAASIVIKQVVQEATDPTAISKTKQAA